MVRASSTDDPEPFLKRFKLAFDRRIVEEYVLTFRDSRKNENGRPMPEDRVWGELADLLGIEGTTRWRYVKGNDGTGKRPLSPFDGRVERYRPGLEEVFRYIAAVDLTTESIGFPRGRIIVSRAAARALTGLRRVTTGEDHTITAAEVERIRFLGRWNRSHLVTAGFCAETVRDMCSEDPDKLMGEIEFSEQFIRSLNRLYADWKVYYIRLLNILSYDWLRC
jgi:hypothetical protein